MTSLIIYKQSSNVDPLAHIPGTGTLISVFFFSLQQPYHVTATLHLQVMIHQSPRGRSERTREPRKIWQRVIIYTYAPGLCSPSLRDLPAFCICTELRIVFYAPNYINAKKMRSQNASSRILFFLHTRARDLTENYERAHFHIDLANPKPQF